MTHGFKTSKLDQITWPIVKAELCDRQFWRALFRSVLWTVSGIVLVFLESHLFRRRTHIHELIWLIILPIPMTLILSLFAGWWHQSRRAFWMIMTLGGAACLVWIPLALLSLIMLIGFSGVQ